MFKRILCPIDASRASLQALDLASRLARDQQAELIVCTVVEPSKACAQAFPSFDLVPKILQTLDEQAAVTLANAIECAGVTAMPQTVTLHGNPVEAIARYAQLHACDVIVIGTHGRAGLRRALLGGVAESVLRRSCVPVIVTRSASEEPQFAASRAPRFAESL